MGSAAVAPLISVVIPAFARTQELRAAVLSVFAQDLPKYKYDLWVVDSSPDTRNETMLRELAESAPCAFHVLRKKPEGPGPSRNLGAHSASGEWIAFMDSDCEATPGWLSGALDSFREGVGLIQGRTIPDPRARLGILTHYVVVEQENHIYECANIFYRRTAFLQTGGFWVDLNPLEHHPMGGEDVELAWQVKRKGWRSGFAPNAVVCHQVLPLTPWGWFYSKPLLVWPLLAKRIPELREFFCARYFYDAPQAFFVLLLAGLTLSPLFPVAIALALPYAIQRASEPTRSLPGPLRLLRVAFYLPKDAVTFGLLLRGSIRFRSLLL